MVVLVKSVVGVNLIVGFRIRMVKSVIWIKLEVGLKWVVGLKFCPLVFREGIISPP